MERIKHYSMSENENIVVEEERIIIENPTQKKNDYLLPASILIAAFLIAASVLYAARAPQGPAVNQNDPGANANMQNTAASLKPGPRDVVLGNSNAKVTVIEYGDYQCPFCGRFFVQTEPLLRSQYIQTGKVKMIFRSFQFLGPESIAAAEAAECAQDQGKFWEYHDALYTAEVTDGKENSGNLNRDLFMKLAGDVKLDTQKFGACIDSNKYASQIDKDRSDAQALGVNSTPTTFVNNQRFAGALPFAQFQAAIESELKK